LLKTPVGRLVSTLILVLLLVFAGSCRPGASVGRAGDEWKYAVDEMPPLAPVSLSQGEKLRVVATTSIVADIVKNIGGDLIELTVLMPPGTDPHTFEPTPQDAVAVADAHVVFINGAGLEVFLDDLLESAGGGATIVPVSYGIELRRLEESHAGGHEEAEAAGRDERHGQFDPHTWFDPNNVITWTDNVEQTLSTLDPDNAKTYQANANAYQAKLEELDAWIREQTGQLSEQSRKLVTDHASLGYFAQAYGFEQIGAVFPGFSTMAAPSAQDLAALEDTIREYDVKAVFVGLTINPDLAERVAADTGTHLEFLYTGSLSEPGGPADNYLALMRYDVTVIIDGLQ